jgi:hypothetical protein
MAAELTDADQWLGERYYYSLIIGPTVHSAAPWDMALKASNVLGSNPVTLHQIW